MAAPLLVGLAVEGGDFPGVASVSIYGLSLLALYAASTLYHSVDDPDLKRLFRRLDHGAVFLLIAGTYTPVGVLVLGDGTGWTLLAVVWLLAAVGIAWKVRWLERFPVLGPIYYLAMGWLAVVVLGPLSEAMTAGEMAWLVAGGIAYTSGVVFYAWKKLPFNHALWHLFVLAGSACHYVMIAQRVWPGA